MCIVRVSKGVRLLVKISVVGVRKDDSLPRENRDMYILMVSKIIMLPREKWSWLY
jgi:hypothetical protein